jgi:hypothetical protein
MAFILTNLILVIGVTFKSTSILGLLGITATGPVAGGLFAVTQGAAIGAGSWMAAAQSIVMVSAIQSSLLTVTTGIFATCCGLVYSSFGIYNRFKR